MRGGVVGGEGEERVAVREARRVENGGEIEIRGS